MRHRFEIALCALLAISLPALAQEGLPPPGDGERLFGFEFEFAGSGNRIVNFEQMPFENYRQMMEVIVEHYGGDPRTIRRVNFTEATSNLERFPSGERSLFRAEWTDGRGRTWQIVPEYVASTGYDGYELVTPPMDDPSELEQVVRKVRESGLVREGLRSGTHLTIDGRRLVSPEGNARALTNLIMLHENLEPMLRRLFNPVRGGGETNRFARSLAADHPQLLEAIDRLPPEQRTRERLESMFERYTGRERHLQEVDADTPSTEKRPWKYRSINLSKILNINPLNGAEANDTVEFRMLDLADAETHRAEAEVYRALVRHAERLAEAGIDVRYEPRVGEAGSQVFANTPADVAEARSQAREMLESLGLEPRRYETLIEENVRPRSHATRAEVERDLSRIARGSPRHNGEAFTYGFELEGRGPGLTGIFLPTDAAVEARWDSMSTAQKRAYYNQVVGENHSSVKTHFKPDPRVEWLDPYWYVEGTGNWEIHSKVMESPTEIAEAMRAAKRGTGGYGRGFHLHMRDNGVDVEALKARGTQFGDFIDRAGNWIWLERARRMRSDLSIKSWSNARPTQDQVGKYASLGNSGRSTIRTQMIGGALDIEIRGLVTWVDDIERLAKVFTDRLTTMEFGPWQHTDNPLEAERTLSGEVERYLREVEGKEMTPEMRRVIDMMATELGGGGSRAREYKRGVLVPLVPWQNEAALSESLRREMQFAQEDYLRSVRFTAQQVLDGRFGFDPSFTSAEQLRERLGLSEATTGRLSGLMGEFRGNELLNRLAVGEGADRLHLLERLDINSATSEQLQERFGLSERQVERLMGYRGRNDALESLQRAGLSESRILDLIDRAAAQNINLETASLETLVEGELGLARRTWNRFLNLREGHRLNGVSDLRSAGLDTATARRVEAGSAALDVAQATEQQIAERTGMSVEAAGRLKALSSLDLSSASQRQLRRAGLSRAEARELVRVRDGLSTTGSLDRAGMERSMRLKVKKWSRTTGLAEGLFESLFAPPGAEREAGFAPPRNTNPSQRRLSDESAREVFEAVRRSAIERAGRGLEYLPYGPVSDAMRQSQRRLAISDLQIVDSRSVDARTLLNGDVRVTTGLLSEIDARARSLPASERPAFRRRALGLIFGHELAHVRGNMSEHGADAEAVRTVANSTLSRIGGVEVPLTEAELRETLRVFDRPTRLGRLYQALRTRPRYGTFAARLRNLIVTSRAAAFERGLPIPERTGFTDRSAETERAAERAAERAFEWSWRDRTYDRPTTEGRVGRSMGVSGLLEGRTGRAAERGRERDRPRR